MPLPRIPVRPPDTGHVAQYEQHAIVFKRRSELNSDVYSNVKMECLQRSTQGFGQLSLPPTTGPSPFTAGMYWLWTMQRRQTKLPDLIISDLACDESPF